MPHILNLALSDYVNAKQPLASITCTMHRSSILLMPRSKCNLPLCLSVPGLVRGVLPESCLCVCVCVCVCARACVLSVVLPKGA